MTRCFLQGTAGFSFDTLISSIMSLFFKQADYARLPVGFETACALVSAKLRNCEYLLTQYATRRDRYNGADGAPLRLIQNRLRRLRLAAGSVSAPRELLLTEARGGRAYWRGVALLCHTTLWKREHRSPRDPINQCLNIGYHLLALECEKALTAAGLYLEAGFLHGERSGKPLLYDFMETFRQPVVDFTVIPLFSRKKVNDASERDSIRFLGKLRRRFDVRFLYRGKCESLRRIILLEAFVLKGAIGEGNAYHPYRYRWGNSDPC